MRAVFECVMRIISAKSIVTAFLIAKLILVFAVQSSNASTLLDEVFYVILLPSALIGLRKHYEQLKFVLLGFAGYSVFALLGAYYTNLGGVPQPLSALLDLAADSKFFIFYFAGFYLISRLKVVDDFYIRVASILMVIALANIPFVLRDVLFSGGVSIRGLHLINRLGYYQPHGLFFSQVESAWFTLFGAYSAFYLYLQKRKFGPFLAVSVVLAMCVLTHFSAKESLALLAGIVVYGVGRGRKYALLKALVLGVGAFGVVFFATPAGDVISRQVTTYVGSGSEDTVRTMLTITSARIANDFFPFGSGGGTFASGVSYQLGYSEVYRVYGVDQLYGGSEEQGNFLTDVFWPKYLGQGGYIGFCCYFLTMFLIYSRAYICLRRLKTPSAVYVFAFALSCLVLSVASAPFNNEVFSLILAFFLAGVSVQLKRNSFARFRYNDSPA